MTGAAHQRDPANLGAATEALISRVFAETALVTAVAAAPLVGVNEKLLREMAEAGVIRSVLVGVKGTTRKFAEADLRAYLAGERLNVREKPCRSTNRARASTGISTSSTKVEDITALLARRRAQKHSGLKRPNA
jgi:hypothetical protein